jgi:hypothetical protein
MISELIIPEAKALALPRASKKSSRRFKISPWKEMGKGGAQREKLPPRDQNPTILLASRQGCKSIVSSLSAFAIALLSLLNNADTATDTIASVLSPLPIGIVFALLKTQISSCFVIFHFMNTTQSAFL